MGSLGPYRIRFMPHVAVFKPTMPVMPCLGMTIHAPCFMPCADNASHAVPGNDHPYPMDTKVWHAKIETPMLLARAPPLSTPWTRRSGMCHQGRVFKPRPPWGLARTCPLTAMGPGPVLPSYSHFANPSLLLIMVVGIPPAVGLCLTMSIETTFCAVHTVP